MHTARIGCCAARQTRTLEAKAKDAYDKLRVRWSFVRHACLLQWCFACRGSTRRAVGVGVRSQRCPAFMVVRGTAVERLTVSTALPPIRSERDTTH